MSDTPNEKHGSPLPYIMTPLLLLTSAQLCPTLCNLMDYSPPDSSVHGVFPARILEWVAISFFR